jgi:hypothetical protein
MPLSEETQAKIDNFKLSDLGSPGSLRELLRSIERTLIDTALKEANGSVSTAARLLGFQHHQSLIAILDGRYPEAPRKAKRKRYRSMIGDKPWQVQNRQASKRARSRKVSQAAPDSIATST